MAGSLKSRESGPFTSSLIAGGSLAAGSRIVRERDQLDERIIISRGSGNPENPTDSPSNTPWQIRLSLGQLIVLWSFVAGTMLMVFLFGLYAGRDQGVQAALAGNSGEAMRLPIANDIQALQSNQNPIAALGDTTSNTAPTEKPANVAKEIPAPAAENSDLSLAGIGANKKELAAALPQESEATAEQPAPNKALSKTEKLEKTAALVPPAPAPAEVAPEKTLTKPEKEKAENTKTVRAGSLGAGWYLQVAAARTGKEANMIGRKLRSAGLAPIIESAEVKGSAYYRVVLGPYASKDAAWGMRKSALASNAARGEPFLKQVK